MEFIYAGELKTKFNIFGHFYGMAIGGKCYQCRSSLEIVLKTIAAGSSESPDAVVIMMNPGSSIPLDKGYFPKVYSINEIFSSKWHKETVPTRPDNAQYQIMRLMIVNDWKFVKVLNLSDLRNGNSGQFSKEFEKASKIDSTNPHCITHFSRRNELKESLKTKKNGPVLAAWGSVEVLRDSAKKIIELVPNIKGLRLDSPWYKYASPYKKEQKLDWLKNINKEINVINQQT